MRWDVSIPDHPAGMGRMSPTAQRVIERWLAPAVRTLFRPSITGLEHLPHDRPFVLVANHSAGMALAELASLMVLFTSHCPERPIAGFAHAAMFMTKITRALFGSLGAIPSTYEAAEAALDAGVPLLIFPGGDFDSLRPIWQAHRVDFNGRQGFLRIAQRAGVPIIPMGISGSHYTTPMLMRGRALAWIFVLPRLVGLRRWGISALGLLGALGIAASSLKTPTKLALGALWMSSPLVFLPIVPWTLRFHIGSPIMPDELFGDLDAALARVEDAVEALVRSKR